MLVETETFLLKPKLCRMTDPQSWDKVNAKLTMLYPDGKERGKVRKALLDEDEAKAFKYFMDVDDAAVKAALDALTFPGMSNAAK